MKETKLRIPDTFEICNVVGYVLGVPELILTRGEREGIENSFNTLDVDKSLKNLRDLCTQRSKLISTYGNWVLNVRENKDILAPEWASRDSLNSINRQIETQAPAVYKYVKDKVKHPEWVAGYIIMPQVSSVDAFEELCVRFVKTRDNYPFQVFVFGRRVSPYALNSDYSLINSLYFLYEQQFVPEEEPIIAHSLNHTEDRTAEAYIAITSFLKNVETVGIVVDSDNVRAERVLQFAVFLTENFPSIKFSMQVYCDTRQTRRWQILKLISPIPTELCMSSRVVHSKNITDGIVIGGICKLHYQNLCDKIIVMSADSDYIPVIKQCDTTKICLCGSSRSMGKGTIRECSTARITLFMLNHFKYSRPIMQYEEMMIAAGILYDFVDSTLSLNAAVTQYTSNMRLNMTTARTSAIRDNIRNFMKQALPQLTTTYNNEKGNDTI